MPSGILIDPIAILGSCLALDLSLKLSLNLSSIKLKKALSPISVTNFPSLFVFGKITSLFSLNFSFPSAENPVIIVPLKLKSLHVQLLFSLLSLTLSLGPHPTCHFYGIRRSLGNNRILLKNLEVIH
ncbi:hypothetical protein GCM10008909_23030 [Hathewaya limosa]